MPITPFHFGLGAALHGTSPKNVSFLSFCAANILIDVESLYNLIQRHHPVHAFFHTYVGASFVAVGILFLFFGMRRFASRFWLPNFLSWRTLNAKQVAIGATFGAYSHIVLDSIMHADIRPFAPFSQANHLLGVLSLTTLHIFCLICAVFGLVLFCLHRLSTAQIFHPKELD